MRFFRDGSIMAAVFLLLQHSPVSGQANEKKFSFLENAGKKEWCAFSNEAAWKAAVQAAGSMRVGTLVYSSDHLSQIYVTEQGESGDWTVYDHYFFDDHGQLVELSRMINVLPGDRSVLQLFSISNGKAEKTETTAKQLSTGKPLTAPKRIWFPKLPIETSAKAFPFSALFEIRGIKTLSCVRETEVK